MTFLQKKLQETVHETIYRQILEIDDCTLEDFEILYEKTLSTLTTNQIHTLLDYIIAKIKIAQEIKISFCKKMLLHSEPFLREKAIMYLEALLKVDCISSILPLKTDEASSVRIRVLWVLAKYIEGDEDLTQQIIDELKPTILDSGQILLAAALYQRNSNPASLEMRYLKDFYLKYYYDFEKQALKRNLTGEHGQATQIIGLILWEAGIRIFAIDSLEMYNSQWLIEKVDKKVPL